MKLIPPSGYVGYLQACERASKTEAGFNNFKQDKHYKGVLEHVSHGISLGYIQQMKKEFLVYLDQIDWEAVRKNDSLGSATTHNYKKHMDFVELADYSFSPSVFRYVHTGLQILEHLKSVGKKESYNILEIGGGYGGQLYILSVLAPLFDIEIKSYTIIDLKWACKLQKKFTDRIGMTTKRHFVEYETYVKDKSMLKKKYDLFVSNYALGEVIKVIQNDYIDNVVMRCVHKYVIWNTKDIHSYLNTNEYSIVGEVPQTGTVNKVIRNKK